MFIKVCRSIIAPKAIKSIVLKNYNFQKLSRIAVLSIGDNDHYLVHTDKNKFVLRVYRHAKHWLQTKSNYIFEMDLLLFLNNNQIPVPYPIVQNNSSYIGKLMAPEGTCNFALFAFAEGQTAQLNQYDCYNYAKIIAKFHYTANNFKSVHKKTHINSQYLISLPCNRIAQFAEFYSKGHFDFL